MNYAFVIDWSIEWLKGSFDLIPCIFDVNLGFWAYLGYIPLSF